MFPDDDEVKRRIHMAKVLIDAAMPTDVEIGFIQGRADGWRVAVESILESVRLHASTVCGDVDQQTALTALVAKACEVQMPGIAADYWRYFHDTAPLTEDEKAQLDRALEVMRVPHVTLTDHGYWLQRRQVANLDPLLLAEAQRRALASLVRRREGEGS